MVARGMQSPCSTLVGNQIGRANVPQAYGYFKATVGFLVALILLQFAVFLHYKHEIISFFAQDKRIYDGISQLYILFIINIVPDCTRGTVKGSLRGLGLQNTTTQYHIYLQGFLMPVLIYYFGIYNKSTSGLLGLWISKTIVDSSLSLSYIYVLFQPDWYEVSKRAVMRITLESRNANCLNLTRLSAEEKELI